MRFGFGSSSWPSLEPLLTQESLGNQQWDQNMSRWFPTAALARLGLLPRSGHRIHRGEFPPAWVSKPCFTLCLNNLRGKGGNLLGKCITSNNGPSGGPRNSGRWHESSSFPGFLLEYSRAWLCLVLIFPCLEQWGQAGAGLGCGRQGGSCTAREHHPT